MRAESTINYRINSCYHYKIITFAGAAKIPLTLRLNPRNKASCVYEILVISKLIIYDTSVHIFSLLVYCLSL